MSEENLRLKELTEIKSQRHAGKFKKFKQDTDDMEMYDWVVDLNLFTDVLTNTI